MDARLLVRSKFMVSHEFGSGDIPREPLVTISRVTKPEETDETTKDWWLVFFAEPWAKPLKVNRTHQQALILMFGAETNDWAGKRIGLYALAGTFFGRRQTAVRIKGSPDLKAPCSFAVRKFGGGTDNYNLVVMATQVPNNAASYAKKVYPPTGTVDFGPKKGTQIPQLTHDELEAAIALGTKNTREAKPGAGWVPKTLANLEELLADQKRRARLEQQMDASPPQTSEPDTDAPF